MTKFIYKIENKINHKIYIGQTNDIKRRFQEHRNEGYGREDNKLLYRAFRKYGIENFSFEVIEETENYNEREQFWIQYYNSHNNGYNMTDGGENPPVFRGENHHLTSHSIDAVQLAKTLLKDTKLPLKEIAKITNYDQSSINRINIGKLWFDESLDYPIRKENTKINKIERAQNIIYDLLNTDLTQKQIAEKYGVGRTTITAINNGQNFYNEKLSYPLRK